MRHSRKLIAGVAGLAILSVGGAALADVTTGRSGRWESRAEACNYAKADARINAGSRARIQRYGPCECDQGSDAKWVCTVDVYYTDD